MQNSDVSGENCGTRAEDTDGRPDGLPNEAFFSGRLGPVVEDPRFQIDGSGEAPVDCQTVEDFFGLESRMTINRVLWTYLESSILTPTELLHGHRELQRLDDRGSLLPSAVSHIARLQTRDTDRPAKEREEEIYTLVDQIVLRARRADPVRLPKLSKRFSDTLAAVGEIGYDDPEYLAMVVLSRELSGIRSWVGKLDRLCKLALEETDDKAVLMLDTVIADVLGANVIQELLRWKRSLGDAIISMLDLADGTLVPEESEAKETVSLLNTLMAEEALPASRHVLIARALSQLRSSAPLYRADPAREKEEYQRVLARLLVLGGIISGAQVADAITARGSRMGSPDDADGDTVADDVAQDVASDGRLRRAAAPHSEATQKQFDGHLEDIVNQLDDVFRERVVGELYRRTMSLKDQMVTVTGAYTKLQKTRFNKKNIGWA